MYSITDGYVYGNISFTVAVAFLLPCWYMLWSLNFLKTETEVKETEENEVTNKDKKNQ